MDHPEFTFAGRLRFGAGSIAALPELLDPRQRQLIVCDRGLADTGTPDRVMRILDAAELPYVVFAEIDPDPDIEVVEAALARARARDCQGLIALGGGSALDAAKALAARMAWPHSLREYGDGLAVPEPVAPLVAIPTTAGTGSEATRVAVITDPARQEKMAIRGAGLVPRAAILDPELLGTLPAAIAAECGADALAHAVEAYLSRNATPMTDVLALAAVERCGEFLRRFVANRGDSEAGTAMLLASHLAGRAFTYAGLGLVHSLAEPLGAFHHLHHGLTCALFLPPVLEFNLPACGPRLARLGHALGLAAAESDEAAARACVAAVRSLLREIDLPDSYAAAGIDFDLQGEMVEQVFPQFSTRCNPREASRAEIEALYRSLA